MFEKIQFEPQEEVLSVVRKHWFVIFLELAGVGFMVLLPIFIVIFLALLPEAAKSFTLDSSHLYLIAYGLCIWLLFSLFTGFMIWTHYYLDLWLITDRRIIVIDQVGFFNRKVSSFRLERLQDVKVVIDGLIPTFLNYGTLHAHTAGNNEDNFTTTGLPDPRNIQSIIQKATDQRLERLSQPSHLEP